MDGAEAHAAARTQQLVGAVHLYLATSDIHLENARLMDTVSNYYIQLAFAVLASKKSSMD